MIKKIKNFVAPRLKRGGCLFWFTRRIYKFLVHVNGALLKRSINGLRKLSAKTGLLSITVDKEGGCVVEFENHNKFWWKNPADPNHLLGMIVNDNHGQYEIKESKLMSAIVKPGDTVFDIGANFGWHSIGLRKIVGAGGAVYCFEPIPETHQELASNIKLNFSEAGKNVITEMVAVGSCDGKTTIFVPMQLGAAFATLIKNHREKISASKSIEVPVIKLDTYVSRRSIKKIDFIKCDAEGAQSMVIEGASGTLKRQSAPMILMEIGSEDGRDIFYRLEKLGYAAYCFTNNNLEKFVGYEMENLPDYNFLFLKPAHIKRVGGAIRIKE